ncbi:MAG: 6,7-dimethyl-8-ribityllumazine synthase [Bacteroidia bacterium]
MSTKLRSPETELKKNKEFRKFKIALVVSDWHPEVTHSMKNAAFAYLVSKGVKEKNISLHSVPGAFELPLGAQFCAIQKNLDAIIALGCVIQGETRHFEFICNSCAQGIVNVSLTFNIPVAFGVLTTENLRQAKERSGGKLGNKGTEAAESVLKMLMLKNSLN